ncbi:hypothetical protein VTI74DRAFT_10954 [Chaetomium olivicolor]
MGRRTDTRLLLAFLPFPFSSEEERGRCALKRVMSRQIFHQRRQLGRQTAARLRTAGSGPGARVDKLEGPQPPVNTAGARRCRPGSASGQGFGSLPRAPGKWDIPPKLICFWHLRRGSVPGKSGAVPRDQGKQIDSLPNAASGGGQLTSSQGGALRKPKLGKER